jgi:hypothetical protein
MLAETFQWQWSVVVAAAGVVGAVGFVAVDVAAVLRVPGHIHY